MKKHAFLGILVGLIATAIWYSLGFQGERIFFALTLGFIPEFITGLLVTGGSDAAGNGMERGLTMLAVLAFYLPLLFAIYGIIIGKIISKFKK